VTASVSSRPSILVICPFPEDIAPAQRLKYEQYIDDWREQGYDVTVSPFMDRKLFDVAWSPGHYGTKILGTLKGLARRAVDLLRLPFYDAVYIFMWVTPLGPPISERIVRALCKILIYDIDDNVHLGQEIDPSYNPNPILRLLKGKGKPIYLMTHADHVVTSSPFLETEALKFNRAGKATYITSSVDTDHFVPRSARPANKKIVVGWTGTFSSRPFIDTLAPMLRELSRRRDFEFRIIGNFDHQMDGIDLNVIRFDKTSEIADLNHFDIGVYPLPDEPWVYGKSGLKAIVYMAMGLPVVASAVGTTPLLYEHGDIGFMVRNDQEWLDALTSLIDSEEERRAKGATARRVAVENYSRQAVRDQYRKVLATMIGAPALPTQGILTK
jgi:glycosyltransferase involved in cell wall biosynthesis